MKTMKIKLSDGSAYTFSTFSLRQQMALKHVYAAYMKLEKENNAIQFEVDEKGEIKKDDSDNYIIKEMTDERQLEMFEKQFEITDVLVKLFRMSISRKHSEFKQNKDKVKDDEFNEKVLDLVDLEDLRDIAMFAMRGVVPIRETEEYDFSQLKPQIGSEPQSDAEETDE